MKTESTQELEQRRNMMIFALENTPTESDSVVYKLAITGIDRELNMRLWKRNVAIGLIVAVVLAILLCTGGCQTIKGAMGDTAWLIQKGADNIQTEGK